MGESFRFLQYWESTVIHSRDSWSEIGRPPKRSAACITLKWSTFLLSSSDLQDFVLNINIQNLTFQKRKWQHRLKKFHPWRYVQQLIASEKKERHE